MSTQLQILRDMSAELGYVREIQTSTADHDCPIHDVPLREERVDTIGGWQAIVVCPAHDGTCVYDPNSTPIPIDEPVTDSATGKAPALTGPASTSDF